MELLKKMLALSFASVVALSVVSGDVSAMKRNLQDQGGTPTKRQKLVNAERIVVMPKGTQILLVTGQAPFYVVSKKQVVALGTLGWLKDNGHISDAGICLPSAQELAAQQAHTAAQANLAGLFDESSAAEPSTIAELNDPSLEAFLDAQSGDDQDLDIDLNAEIARLVDNVLPPKPDGTFTVTYAVDQAPQPQQSSAQNGLLNLVRAVAAPVVDQPVVDQPAVVKPEPVVVRPVQVNDSNNPVVIADEEEVVVTPAMLERIKARVLAMTPLQVNTVATMLSLAGQQAYVISNYGLYGLMVEHFHSVGLGLAVPAVALTAANGLYKVFKHITTLPEPVPQLQSAEQLEAQAQAERDAFSARLAEAQAAQNVQPTAEQLAQQAALQAELDAAELADAQRSQPVVNHGDLAPLNMNKDCIIQ